MSTYPTNLAKGQNALGGLTTGTSNIGIGGSSLLTATTGSSNVAIGASAGSKVITGSNNTFLGAQTTFDASANTWSNSTAIGYGATINASNQITIGTSTENVVVPGTTSLGDLTKSISTSVTPTTYNPITQPLSNTNNGFLYYYFTTVGTTSFVYNGPTATANVVLVGGGGGGGRSQPLGESPKYPAIGGGGGGGGVIVSSISLTKGNTLSVTVGNYSAISSSQVAYPNWSIGGPSIVSGVGTTLTANGGGVGGAGTNGAASRGGTSGTPYSGGIGVDGAVYAVYGGGGGGAEGVGATGSETGAAGGIGKTVIFEDNTSFVFGVGGVSPAVAAGGSVGVSGAPNTGNGGGGGILGTALGAGFNGGYGGTGMVLIYFDLNTINSLTVSGITNTISLNVYGESIINKYAYCPTYPGAWLCNSAATGSIPTESSNLFPVFTSMDISSCYLQQTGGDLSCGVGTITRMDLNTPAGYMKVILSPGYAVYCYNSNNSLICQG